MTEDSSPDIAVIGMAGRFAGARDVEEYWNNLRNGVESVRTLTDEELLAAGVAPELLSNPDYVKSAAILDGVDQFDAGLFNLSPKDAAIMDPQHRHLLECAWEAMEHAGHTPDRFQGSIGVFAGCGMNAYFMFNLLTNRRLMDSTGLFLVRHTGNDKDFLATRVSYNFNLKGPSVNVQTACSTSLVAIHMASQSLLSGECDMALAGGVTIEIPHGHGYLYQEGEILSRDGHCRAFDASSTGTIFGSGAGIVVLRRLDDALADGSNILAVIKGSAINNDGSRKVGYLAPSVDGQSAAIAEALGIAGISADTIGLVAAHGTGTQVGDPIEVTALTQAFRRTTARKQFCALTSVKNNIGHTDTAAGVASFIAAVQAIRYSEIPPTIHFEKPNPLISLPDSPFVIHPSLQPWNSGDNPRRAGVSSLGVGGTNAHVIVEQAPELPATDPGKHAQLFTLSALTANSLDGATNRLADYLSEHSDVSLADAAYTTNIGRKEFVHRRIVVAAERSEATGAIRDHDSRRLFSAEARATEPSVAFIFPGGGSQHPNMGLELYGEEPVYREAVDKCLALLKPALRNSVRNAMFPAPGELEAAARALEIPSIGLPALFMVEYAVARLWLSWGIRPAALIGHSVGAYAEACIAGIMSLEDALNIVVLRGQLFDTLPEGGMVSVPLTEQRLQPLLNGSLSVAAINTPGVCTVSGTIEALEKLEKTLALQDVETRRLRISVAAHSPMVEPILEEFAAGLRNLRLKRPEIPCVSCLTGSFLQAEEATDPTFWVRKLRNTVRFADGVQVLLDNPDCLLLEVGPGQSLTSVVRQHPGRQSGQPVYASLPRAQELFPDRQHMLHTLGKLWCHGQRVEWERLYAGQKRRRIPLPSYAFDRQRYWIEGSRMVAAQDAESPAPAPALTRRNNVAEWYQKPTWIPAALPSAPVATDKWNWLVFADDTGLGAECIRQLHAAGHTVFTVRPGSGFRVSDNRAFEVHPGRKDDYESLLKHVGAETRIHRVLHLWSVREPVSQMAPDSSVDRAFHSLLNFVQVLAASGSESRLHIAVVSNNLYSIGSESAFAAERAVLLGPCRVIPAEFPEISCGSIDVNIADPSGVTKLAATVLTEAVAEGDEAVVAYRDKRYVQKIGNIQVAAGDRTRLRPRGVYLITGGLGGIALTQAEFLARETQGTLVLASRTGLPGRDGWDQWLSSHGDQEITSTRIRAIRKLEELGARVVDVPADVTSLEHMSALASDVRSRFGAVNGILHTAGVLDDGAAQFKHRDAANRVLAPKVAGTLVLDSVFGGTELDFFVVFSSTSSVIAPPGQIDYVAANSFLDVFAQQKSASGKPYIAINWGAWREVGLTARLSSSQDGTGTGTPAGHPMLGVCTVNDESRSVYEAVYDRDAMWVLSEHTLRDGTAVLPGTAYIDLAAFRTPGSSLPCQIDNLFFVNPLQIGPDSGKRQVRAAFHRSGSGHEFSLSSRATEKDEWVEHGTAEVRSLSAVPGKINIDEIISRCQPFASMPPCGPQAQYVQFGERFQCLKEVYTGKGEAIAFVELPASYLEDCNTFPLHPAMLDMATGFGMPLIRDYPPAGSLYVPFSYGSIQIYQRLPAKVVSYVRYRDRSEPGYAIFDVTIADPDGNVLLEAKEFTIKSVGEALPIAGAAHRNDSKPIQKTANPMLQEWIRNGVTPAEGAEVLQQILASGVTGQVIASPIDVNSLVTQVRPKRTAASAASTDSIAPASTSSVEAFLIQTWKDLLGIDQVGLNDDFFELGGHSLIAVRLFNRIRKAYNVEFGLATLFEARTVRQLAALLDKPEEPRAFSSLVPVQRSGPRPPLYMIHGVGGNVIGFDALVRRLGPDQPVYALQSRGLDGIRPHLTTIEEMAEHYIAEIQLVQPQGPYYLLGYSFGGLIAFEMAHRLQAAGHTVGLLGMLDTFQLTFVKEQSKLSSKALSRYRDKLKFHSGKVIFGPDRIQYIREGLQRQYKHLADRMYGAAGVAPPSNFSVIQQANEAAGHAYKPQPYPGEITLFRAEVRPPFEAWDRTLGWTGLASTVRVIDVPGDHMNMGEEPNASTLAASVTECLTGAIAKAAASA